MILKEIMTSCIYFSIPVLSSLTLSASTRIQHSPSIEAYKITHVKMATTSGIRVVFYSLIDHGSTIFLHFDLAFRKVKRFSSRDEVVQRVHIDKLRATRIIMLIQEPVEG